jgi:hypothetical protein
MAAGRRACHSLRVGKGPSKSAKDRGVCARSAFDSAMAVRIQVGRLRAFDPENAFEHARRTADAQFLVVALWRLRMAGEMAASLSAEPARMNAALGTFDTALPQIRSLRHVLMHHDNYALENEQRRNTHPETGDPYGAKDVEGLWTSPDHFVWLGVSYELDAVECAAAALYGVIAEEMGEPGWG